MDKTARGRDPGFHRTASRAYHHMVRRAAMGSRATAESNMPFLLDGNNLIGLSAAQARSKPLVRRAFLEQLSRYAGSRGGRLIVFFDGDAPERSLPPGGIRVRYAAPVSSDEAILQGIAASMAPGEIIVVTNDRSLAARCRDRGAKTIAWSEFAARMEKRAGSSSEATGKEESVDVEDWSRYFGVDPDSLK